jgi:hypothetical protein
MCCGDRFNAEPDLSPGREVRYMARKKSDRARDREINERFEQQGRRLKRKWSRNAVGGLILLIVAAIVLQFTPYRDLPGDIFDAAKGFLQSLTSGKSAPVEPDPKYW